MTGGEGFGIFGIGSTDGILFVDEAILDYETRQVWTVTVTVTDGDGLSGSSTVTINVKDTNEKPTLGTATREVKERRDKDTLSSDEREVKLSVWRQVCFTPRTAAMTTLPMPSALKQ